MAWEEGIYVETQHSYGNQHQEVMAQLRTYAATQKEAEHAAEVAFRYMLQAAGIDWRQGGR